MTIPYSKRILVAVALVFGLLVLHARLDRPRVLAVNEVPIAFWAWRTHVPSQSDINRAFAPTKSKTLFLPAGHFDLAAGNVKRIREVSGELPAGVEIHLVYNATRDFLAGWNQLGTIVLADEIARTYEADLARGQRDSARVRGLQLDFDVPTRLLREYAKMLAALRPLLPPDSALSITGLPTWTDADEIQLVLDAVNFWIPQCYGGKIPTHRDQRIPISSSDEVE